MSNRILITGGAGFIGSHLVNFLFEKGKDIVVLDNLSPQIHGVNGTSYTLASIQGKCQFIQGDVRSIEDWEKALEGVKTVIHLAAETGTGQSMYETGRYVAVNCQGTAILADLLNQSKYGIKQVILASSRAIYGEGKYDCPTHGTIFPENRTEKQLSSGQFECLCPNCKTQMKPMPTDESSRINPLSVYGLTKYFQENLLLSVCNALDLKYTALRFQNVYGPGQSLANPYTGIISIFANRIRQNKEVFIFEDGLESRDFVFVDDIVNSIWLAQENYDSKQSIYNVGMGKMTSVMEIAQTLKSLINPDSSISITGQYRKGDIRHNYADLSLISSSLDFNPKIDIKTGLEKFVSWLVVQEVANDGYEKSLQELQDKGLMTK
jgi:dTDP-L-rhamnose 4-epimerase